MAAIDLAYYTGEFKAKRMPDADFRRLADIASDIIHDICRVKPSDKDLVDDRYKKAVAYQVEFLEAQGGVDAVLGFSEASQAGNSESLGDYSVSGKSGTKSVTTTADGVPVSPMAIVQLRMMGLMSRWAFAGSNRG